MGFITDASEPSIGFTRSLSKPRRFNSREEMFAKAAKSETAFSERYNKRKLASDISAKEELSAFKKRAKEVAKKKQASYLGDIVPSRRGIVSQIKSIGSEVSRFGRSGGGVDPRLEEIRRREILRRAEMQGPKNFFEHRDPIEVYGDDELDFFDSQGKAFNKRRTGSFFGI